MYAGFRAEVVGEGSALLQSDARTVMVRDA